MSRKRILIALSACAATFIGGYGVRVLAEGAPVEQPLFYSGVLESNGSLASGEHTITLELYDAQSGGTELCAIERASEVAGGRFRIDASECADAVRENADVWVAVSFVADDGVERTIPGRSKVGAVPYALEADRAKVASSASAASGELETTIAQLTARVAALEAGGGGGPPVSLTAFQAIKTTQGPLSEGGTQLVFNEETFDLTDEHDPETGLFIPKQAGRYEFFCSIAWDIPDDGPVGTFEAGIVVDGSERVYNGFYGEGRYATRQVHAVIELDAGQEVYCASWQSDATVTLNLRYGLTTFEGRRFSL
jgi:hypothetical protein